MLRRLPKSALVGVSVGLAFVVAPAASQAAIVNAHPKAFINGEAPSKPGVHEPFIAWGTIRLKNASLGTLECVNLFFGANWNETEPEGTTEKAYGEILEWTATGFTNKEGGALSSRCKVSTAGAEAYAAVEPPLQKTKEVATVEGSEKIVIKEAKRDVPSVPWKGEGETSEIARHERFLLRVGMPQVSNASGTTGGGRHGECYPGEEVTEIPHTATSPTTEKIQIPAPSGCVRVNTIINDEALALHLEVEFQGTQRTLDTNSSSGNCLSPSKGEIKEAEAGTLESAAGPGSTNSVEGEQVPLKTCGFQNEEGLTLGAP